MTALTHTPRIYRTERPGVVLAESRSDPNELHVVWSWGTPFARCSCPAGRVNRDCSHIIAAMEAAEEELMATEGSLRERLEAEPTKALVPQTSVAARAQERALSLERQAGGLKYALELAEFAIASGVVPQVPLPKGQQEGDAKMRPMSPNEAALFIAMANSLDLSWDQAFTAFVPIPAGGIAKPFLTANGVLAVIERSGKGFIRKVKSDATACTAEAVRGRRRSVCTITIEDARLAGWSVRRWKDQGGGMHEKPKENWESIPGRMLWKRCVTLLGAELFSDVLMGMALAGETYEGEVDVVTTEEIESAPSHLIKHEIIEGEAREVSSDPVPAPTSVPTTDDFEAFWRELGEMVVAMNVTHRYVAGLLDIRPTKNAFREWFRANEARDADLLLEVRNLILLDREPAGDEPEPEQPEMELPS